MGLAHDELVVLGDVLAQNGASGNDVPIAEPQGPDHAALPAQEDGGLVEHDPSGHIPDEGGGGLVAVGREVEVDVGAPHLAVVLAACAAGHQAVTEIDQAAKGHEGEEDGLLQPDAVGPARLFLQDAALPHLRAKPHVGLLEKNGFLEVAALELHLGSDLAVLHGDRPLSPELCARRDDGLFAVDATARVDPDPFPRNLLDLDFFPKSRVRGLGMSTPFCTSCAIFS